MAQPINFEPEHSSHVRRLSYDPENLLLEVTFHNHATYTHAKVPAPVFAAMTRQHSVGTYYHRVIRRHYPLVKKVADGRQDQREAEKA